MRRIDEQKIKEVTRRYLKEYLDKDWMVPLKRFMHMDDTEKAIQCAYVMPMMFKRWVENNDEVLSTLEEMIENEEIRPDILDLDYYEFDEYADEIFKGRLNEYAEDFVEYVSSSGDRDMPLFCAAAYQRDIYNEWLIHMTNNLSGIANEGFNVGVTIDELAYTPATGTTDCKYGPGYNFAFEADDAYTAEHSNYGKYCVLFQGSGIMIWHYGDEQDQVIFYGPSAKNLIIITPNEENGEWEIKSDITNRTLYSSEKLQDVVDWCIANFTQYHNHLTGRSQPAYFKHQREKAPELKWWSGKKVSEGIFSKYCELI